MMLIGHYFTINCTILFVVIIIVVVTVLCASTTPWQPLPRHTPPLTAVTGQLATATVQRRVGGADCGSFFFRSGSSILSSPNTAATSSEESTAFGNAFRAASVASSWDASVSGGGSAAAVGSGGSSVEPSSFGLSTAGEYCVHGYMAGGFGIRLRLPKRYSNVEHLASE